MAGLSRRLVGIAGAAVLAAMWAASPAFATGVEPAQATKAPPAVGNVSGVTVTAPEKPNPLVNPESQFVRGHLAENRNQQYARFRDPICVRVLGLPPEFDAFIAKRVVELAEEVKAPVDPSPACTPNVNVIFSPKPQAQLDDIAKRRDVLFGYFLKAETKKVTTFTRPIQAWYLTRARDTLGNNILELLETPPCVGSGAPGAPPCDIKAPAVMGKAGSRLGNDMSTELVHALILADATKVADAKIGAVADYVAVLALARWQGLEHCNALPTILNLMADGCEADAIAEAATPGDLGLLEGLYTVNPRESGSQQRMTIAGRMETAVKKDAAEGDRR
ncbi:hypothetical protein [Phenylobacterium sp.]|uniref:hypothetical protein n=1 Tax=Phenylobacterium sp. TaxID=1871053 RepID=UPI002C328A4D|nr:hypothetical protein [Phenylobacterium sp.]HLZ75240.1 hypothetical protein [Phenylobacterium sp.]